MKKILFIVLMFNACNLPAQENIRTNIKTYCKVWGVCKYYSNTNTNWDEVFFDQYDNLLDARNDKDLNTLIASLIAKTNLKKNRCAEYYTKFSITDFHKLKKNRTYHIETDFHWITGSKNISHENAHLLLCLLKNFKGKKPRTISVHDNIIKQDKEPVYHKFSDRIALLALLRFYNAIEYYYPYKDLLDTEWDSVLTKMIPVFLKRGDIYHYKNALNHMASFLQDSHVEIDFGTSPILQKETTSEAHTFYPIKFGYIGGELYVSNVLNDSISTLYDLEKGDKISMVNGKAVDIILHESERYYSVSRKEDGYFALLNYLRNVDSLKLTIDNRSFSMEKVEMTKNQFIELYRYGELANTIDRNKIELGESVGYVYLPTAKYATLDNIFRKYKEKKTIILDCRGYGSLAALKLPKLLSNQTKDVASSYLATKKFPGIYKRAKDETYYISNSIDLIGKFLFGYKKKIFPTFNAHYKGNVIVLIDNHAISFGETVAMIIKVYAPNAVFIGRPTAGANGNVSTLTLPLGGVLIYTTVDFKFADDTQVQRRGIQPDIFVPRTIEADICGKDEILNVALRYHENTEED